jgi:hypothetical protein
LDLKNKGRITLNYMQKQSLELFEILSVRSSQISHLFE